MSKISKFTLSFIVVCLTLLSSGCGLVPKGIREIFISPTPTVTPTATSTPLPPISIIPCSTSDCSGAVYANDLLGFSPQINTQYELRVPYDAVLSFNAGWITTDYPVMQDNLSHIKWIFNIDGQPYFQPDMVSMAYVQDENDFSVTHPVASITAVLQGWKINQSHLISIGYTFPVAVSDGWRDYPAGHTVTFIFNVVPRELPTPTPTNTLTPTATVTLTPKPRPTFIPYTKTPAQPTAPACEVDSTIEIDNSTGGFVTLYLSGPTKFTFNIPTGVTTWNVCSGSYSYTAYGCGGASDTGTINSGESSEFYCN